MKKAHVIGSTVAVAAAGVLALSGSGSTCEVTAVETVPTVLTHNGELDWGALVNVTVVLEGAGDEVVVESLLQTNVGDFTRSMPLVMAEDQSRTVTFEFPEPPFGATFNGASAVCK